MANTCELKLKLNELRETAGDPDQITGVVLKVLAVLAKRLRMDVPMVWHLVDPAVKKVQEEMKKFCSDPDKPYPPLGKTELIIYLTLPEPGKLAQGVEWREQVIV